MDQHKYTKSLLERHNFGTDPQRASRTHKTPLPTDAKFTSTLLPGETLLPPGEKTVYQSIIGSLLYVHTRPDMAYCIGKMARFMHAPTTRHLQYAGHILKYLRGTTDLGIRYKADGDNILRGNSDASFLDADDGKSTIGFIIELNGAPIIYKSKLSPVVCTSTSYAEYCAIYACTREVMSLRTLMAELGLPQKFPTPILTDNKSALEIATATIEPSSHRHINMRFHYVRECMHAIVVRPVSTDLQRSDILTKSLTFPIFDSHRSELTTKILHKPDLNPFNLSTVSN